MIFFIWKSLLPRLDIEVDCLIRTKLITSGFYGGGGGGAPPSVTVLCQVIFHFLEQSELALATRSHAFLWLVMAT